MAARNRVLAGARTIRPRLAQLLGPKAGEVDRQLGELIDQAAAGQSVDVSILELLAERPATRDWIAKYLASDKRRGFTATPGLSGHVDADKYACPIPGCTSDWAKSRQGERVPGCAVHHVTLVRVGTT